MFWKISALRGASDGVLLAGLSILQQIPFPVWGGFHRSWPRASSQSERWRGPVCSCDADEVFSSLRRPSIMRFL